MLRRPARQPRPDPPARALLRAPLLALGSIAFAAALIAPASTRAEEGAAPEEKPRDEKPAPKPKRPGSDERGEPTGNPECVSVRTEARYVAYGYDHIVEVENACDKAVRCTVATDVNPTSSSLAVPPRQTRSVTTFRGSPAREFKADVACQLQD
jgi:hypothetical protein